MPYHLLKVSRDNVRFRNQLHFKADERFMGLTQMLMKILCIFGLTGLLSATTTPSLQDCYTQPPGRGQADRVMSCQDKYAVIPEQLYCQKNIQRHPLSETENNEIEDMHNKIRSEVKPLAANMLQMKYNDGLGRTAQVWAEMCQLTSSKPLQRFRPGSFSVGENVYVSQTNMTWSEVIDAWARENSSFTHSSAKNNERLVSNYVQLVWAKTSAVGCAKSKCGGKFFYVCHYAPGMDSNNLTTPYEASKQPCLRCTGNCTNKLCDCKGIICLNGADLNYGTCLCDCIKAVKTYEPPTCELQCDANGDDPACGTTYQKSTCRSGFETMFHCPWMCDLCPYAGKNYTERSVPLPWERNRTECPPVTTTDTTQGHATGANQRMSTSSMATQQDDRNGCSSTKVATWAVFLTAVQTFFSTVKKVL